MRIGEIDPGQGELLGLCGVQSDSARPETGLQSFRQFTRPVGLDPGERREHLVGRDGGARLLQAHHVVDRQAGQLRDLLAPQARRAPARPGGQPHLRR